MMTVARAALAVSAWCGEKTSIDGFAAMQTVLASRRSGAAGERQHGLGLSAEGRTPSPATSMLQLGNGQARGGDDFVERACDRLQLLGRGRRL